MQRFTSQMFGVRTTRFLIIGLLSIHAVLLAWGASRQSPTLNEPGHLVSGISHWQKGRFGLYRVNPPLVRMVAALPVMVVDHQVDWSSFTEVPGIRAEFDLGRAFVTDNGERSTFLFSLARWACLPLNLLGGYVCFRWGRELYGTPAGFLTLTLWTFSPNLIAHGQCITPDAGATALGVTAAYLFWHWLKSPSWFRALGAGIGLGLAELSKMTWIILFGLWPVIWILWQCRARKQNVLAIPYKRQAGQLGAILLLALYLLNMGYGFQGSFTKLRDFQFVSKSMIGSEESDISVSTERSGNRFAHSWIGALRVPVPQDYLLGLDVQKRDFENQDHRLSYLRGNLREQGWWYYYLYALGIKVPLGTWLLLLLAVMSRLVWAERFFSIEEDLVPLSLLFCLLVVVSSQTGFSHHMRYVLPIFPFAFIWIGQVARSFSRINWRMVIPAAGAVVWSISSSLWIYPHSLSYFNELVGGPDRGHAHLINSNIDWGQDLIYLKEWLDRHPDARPFNLAYFGCSDPGYLGIDYKMPARQRGEEENSILSQQLEPGWYAISVNLLRGYPANVPRGNGGWQHMRKNSYRFFLQFQPIAKAGYSIYIYKIEESQFQNDKVGRRLKGKRG